MIIGYLPMTADLIHVGHISAIDKCFKMCDILIVGLLSDGAIRKYKGSSPIIPYRERAKMLKSLDRSFLFAKQTSINPKENLKKYKADILFSGDGFEKEEKEIAKKLKIKLGKFEYYSKQSTTKIYDKIRSKQTKKTTTSASSSKR